MPFTPEELNQINEIDSDETRLIFDAIMARLDSADTSALSARVAAIETMVAVNEALAVQVARLQGALVAATDRAAFTAAFDGWLDSMEPDVGG